MFRKLLTIEEAKTTIRQHFKPKPLGTEQVPLLQATGRILAENIIAQLNIPPFDRSTVDGYAVRAEDTFGAEETRPIQLELAGTINIGELPHVKITKGKAAEIVTGAPTPQGADAVVMTEHAERTDNTIRIYAPVVKDENIMKASSDIKKGQQLLTTCQPLGSREIGMIAAIGKPTIKVYKIPKVAVLSTGPEITEPGKKLTPGKIYDINAYTLSSAVTEAGGSPLYLGVIQDNLQQLQRALKRASPSRYGHNLRRSLSRPKRHHAQRSQHARKTWNNSQRNLNQTGQADHSCLCAREAHLFPSWPPSQRAPRYASSGTPLDPATSRQRTPTITANKGVRNGEVIPSKGQKNLHNGHA